ETLTANNVEIRENGQRVNGARVVAAEKAGKRAFGVVLVVDASWSMRGEPLTRALDAARAFVAKRTSNEQIGLITFSQSVSAPLAPTADQKRIDAALAKQPRLGVGTRIFDAVDAAIALLRKAKITAGSVVLLSDGADTGSSLRLAQLERQALAAHVRVFT